MTGEELLTRLEGVRKSGEGWMAKCPAHEDRTASLSVGIGTDGRVLLHCFAECGTHSIAESLGIDLSDLFPERIETYAPAGRAPRHNPADLLRVIQFEAQVVVAAARVILNGGTLTATDFARLQEADLRIWEAMRRAA